MRHRDGEREVNVHRIVIRVHFRRHQLSRQAGLGTGDMVDRHGAVAVDHLKLSVFWRSARSAQEGQLRPRRQTQLEFRFWRRLAMRECRPTLQ